MKYVVTILISGLIILGICFTICENQLKKINNILETDPIIAESTLISFDSIEVLVEKIQNKNQAQHTQDLYIIDSLQSKIEHISTTPKKIKVSKVSTTIYKDTTIYKKYYRDSTIYNYDTITKQVVIFDTIYVQKKVLKKRKKK